MKGNIERNDRESSRRIEDGEIRRAGKRRQLELGGVSVPTDQDLVESNFSQIRVPRFY
jgi:hypothetical protein